jgi:hypothetical protein
MSFACAERAVLNTKTEAKRIFFMVFSNEVNE